ncbi:predicted protein [Postia placenta Mad-698-R]|nr:predicted protein [Postia placenta Mad-698-R]
MPYELPPELWLQIFHYAAEDEPLFDYALPTSMTESSWSKRVMSDGWTLRAPNDLIEIMHRKSFATKKAIVSTCRAWRDLGTEFLFRCLLFGDPSRFQQLRVILDADNSLGRRAKRLHIARFYAGHGSTLEETQDALVSIIRHCPNLEAFIVTWSFSNSLAAVVDALCTYCPRNLRTLQLYIPTSGIAKAILMLDSLPALVSVHFQFEGVSSENIRLGSTSAVTLTLNSLEQLQLRGPFQEFLEQATGWKLPALRSLSLDFLSFRDDLPDIIEFLTHHGDALTYLDINCVPALDVATILDLCPNLTTFAFNPDWRIASTYDITGGGGTLVHRPHEHITTIGCHQLLHAFDVGDAAKHLAIDPLATLLVQRRNDRNFAALTKRDFPRLQRVRVLNRTLLRDLEAADGPQGDAYERWERWWDQCARQGIRLEDCTGALLGTLPLEEEDDESESESEDDEAYLAPLREVLEECRQLPSVDESEYFFTHATGSMPYSE